MCLQQSGNHHNALRTGIDHTLQIVNVDSADAENRQAHLRMDAPDVCKTDRHVIGFLGVAKIGPNPM